MPEGPMASVVDGLPLVAESPPLRVDEGGAVRVGRSRVTLDVVVGQYENGMTPEDMVRAYDTLAPADVHAVIAYYLRHRTEARAYLDRRAAEAAGLKARIEAERPRCRGTSCWPAGPRGRPMLRLAADADVHGEIVRGLHRRRSDLDLVRVQDVLPEGTPDLEVLAWAAAEGRVLITNDRNTMVGFAYARVAAGEPVPGLLATTSEQSIGSAMDDILPVA
jgi:uncharacterized protein (DUF433 family)